MPNEQELEARIALHRALDLLITAYLLAHPDTRPTRITAGELLTFSHRRILEATQIDDASLEATAARMLRAHGWTC